MVGIYGLDVSTYLARELPRGDSCAMRSMSANQAEIVRVLGKVIDLMRAEGLKIESEYDFENFMTDHGCEHSILRKTGRFEDSEDDEEDGE